MNPIIFDAKHEKTIMNDQDFFSDYIWKFLPIVAWNFWIETEKKSWYVVLPDIFFMFNIQDVRK